MVWILSRVLNQLMNKVSNVSSSNAQGCFEPRCNIILQLDRTQTIRIHSLYNVVHVAFHTTMHQWQRGHTTGVLYSHGLKTKVPASECQIQVHPSNVAWWGTKFRISNLARGYLQFLPPSITQGSRDIYIQAIQWKYKGINLQNNQMINTMMTIT